MKHVPSWVVYVCKLMRFDDKYHSLQDIIEAIGKWLSLAEGKKVEEAHGR